MVVQVYSAEALVLLGRVSEAMTHLSPESVVNISVSSPKPGPSLSPLPSLTLPPSLCSAKGF